MQWSADFCDQIVHDGVKNYMTIWVSSFELQNLATYTDDWWSQDTSPSYIIYRGCSQIQFKLTDRRQAPLYLCQDWILYLNLDSNLDDILPLVFWADKSFLVGEVEGRYFCAFETTWAATENLELINECRCWLDIACPCYQDLAAAISALAEWWAELCWCLKYLLRFNHPSLPKGRCHVQHPGLPTNVK